MRNVVFVLLALAAACDKPAAQSAPDAAAVVTATASASVPASSAPVVEAVEASAQVARDASVGPSASQRAQPAGEVDRMQMEMLKAYGGPSAVQGALDRGDVVPNELSAGSAKPIRR